ncbi:MULTISPECIES: DUF6164 family protein [unclassified Thalassolituus]|jgi:hypothetical protein|uniref:DUF6164 family protein n=1 Tax=Oceanospirillaceae TaxID=135620 RepID=UPI00118FB53D|nr:MULTISPECIES: DUF6164 family protein [unclassified Thalassolituus]TVV42486.1 DUF2007 domain-containing protein [Thalassolituus sp. C2-1]
MAKLLFRLNGVNEDEAEDVRTLLQDAGIEFYETDEGRWRISVAAIWLRHNDDYEQARGLLDQYQQERLQRIRSEYEQQQQEGNTQSMLQRWLEQPAELIMTLIAVLLVLGLTLWPFLSLGQ